MDHHVRVLAAHINALLSTHPPNKRLLIGISGIPGSGKTTLALRIVRHLNGQHSAEAPVAQMLPMDGFHLYRRELDEMPDPAEAHRRRGAPWTFNPGALLEVLKRCRDGEVVHAPGFDHRVKDPVEGEIVVGEGIRVVVVEGNYLALDEPLWRDIAAMMDESWFVEVEESVARERLAGRHVEAGIVTTLEDGYKRADDNDLPNGREIMKKRVDVHRIITSEEDETVIGKKAEEAKEVGAQ